MSRQIEYALKLNAMLTGNLESALRHAQSTLNAFKTAAAMPTNVELHTRIQGLQSALATLQQLQNIKKSLPEMYRKLQEQGAKVSTARQERDAAKSKVDTLKIQLEQLKAQRSEVRRNSDAYKALSAQIKQIKSDMKSAAQELKAAEQNLSAAQGKNNSMAREYSQQVQRLRELQAALRAAGHDVTNLSQLESRLSSQFNNTTAAIERQAQVLARVQNASSRLGDAQGTWQTAQMAASTIVSPLTASINEAATFEKQMSQVKALTQLDNIRSNNLDKMKSEMSELTELAKTEGLRTQFSAVDAAKAETYYAYAGWNTSQIKNAIPSTLDLATAADMQDLGRVADITSNIMTAFKIPAEEVGRVSDVLTYTFTHSNQDFTQLGETMKYAAPIARLFGSSLEEAAAMTKFMADAGIQASQAGTSMRQTMLRLTAPPKRSQRALEENGMTVDDANKAWLNANAILLENVGEGLDENATAGQQMAKIIRLISTKMADKTSKEKLAIFNAVTGLNAVSGAANLFEGGGEMVTDPVTGQQITKLEMFTRELENSKGATEQIANVMRDNYWGSMVALESAMSGLKIEIGEAITPTLKTAAELATNFVRGFGNFAREHPAIVQGLAAIAAGVAAVIVATAGLSLAFAAFEFGAAQVALFRAALSGAELASVGLAGRLGALARAVKGLAIFNTFSSVTGWSVLATKIRAVGTSLRTLTFASVASSISAAATTATASLTTMGSTIMRIAGAGVGFMLSPLGIALAGIAIAAYNVYQNWDKISPVMESLSNTITARVAPAFEAAKVAFESAGESINHLFQIFTGNTAAEAFSKGFIAAAKVIAETLAAIVQLVAYSVAAMASLFGGLADVISNIFKGNFDEAKVAAQLMYESTTENLKRAVVEPLKTIKNIPEGVDKALNYYDNLQAQKSGEIPTAAKVAAHRVDATPEQVQEQLQRIEIGQIAPTAAATARHRTDATPLQIQSQLNKIQTPVNVLENRELRAEQIRREVAASSATREQVAQINPITLAQQNFAQNYTPGATSINLDTSKVQSQINSLGESAANSANSVTANTTSINSISESVSANSAAISANSAALEINSSAANTSASALEINSASAANSANSLEINSSAATNSASSIDSMSASAVNSQGGIDSMTNAAYNSQSGIDNLASSSSSASSSVSGLGSAASSAISALLSAASSVGGAISGAISSAAASVSSFIGGGSVAQNYSGGIYNHGAFLTWFAERSPEAAIPLDGSERAISLWQTAGQILGVYPDENYSGGIYARGGSSISTRSFRAQDSFKEIFKMLANALTENNRVTEKLTETQNNFSEEVRNSQSYKSLTESETTALRESSKVSESILIPESGVSTTSQIGNIFSQIGDVIGGKFGGVISKAENILSGIEKISNGKFENIISGAGSIISSIGGKFSEKAQSIISGISNAVNGFMQGGIGGAIAGVGTMFKGRAGEIISGIGNVVTGIWNGGGIGSIISGAGSIFGGKVGEIFSSIGGIFNGGGLFSSESLAEHGIFNGTNFEALTMGGGFNGGNLREGDTNKSANFNITVNISGNNAQDIWQSFESQFENYMSEFNRRSFF